MADADPLSLFGSILAPGVGSIVGDIFAGGAQDQANLAAQQALQQYSGITAPDAAALQVALQQQRNTGNLSAIQEATMQQGQSTLNGFQTDPRLINAQMGALQQMQQLGNTGLTAADRAALLQINNQSAGQAAANRASIMQNMAARGMAGGGAELAAQLAGSQAAANQGAYAGQSLAGQAQANALQAMANAGGLGSQMQGQQFGQAATQAQAQNAINQFNTANAQQVAAANTGYQNQAQQYNIQNAQAIANANAGITNQQKMYNSQMTNEAFNDAMQKANATANAAMGNANYFNQQAQQTRGQFGQIGQGIGQGLTGLNNYNMLNNYFNPQKAATPANTSNTYAPNMAQAQQNNAAFIGPPQQ